MPTPPKPLDIWILAGQSNMEGGGLLRESLPADDRVWCFSSAGNWEIAEDPLHRPWESFTENHRLLQRAEYPIAEGKTDAEMAEIASQTHITGTGLGIAFGIALAEKTGQPVGLIPCAHGGTRLEQWDFQKKTTADLYGGMLERVRRAGGTLRGILWYQGESDATPTKAVDYGERLAEWIRALRNDLSNPTLPVLAVQLAGVVSTPDETQSITGWETVRESLQLLPSHLENVTVTGAIDLGLHDAIHLDSTSLHRLGRRLARLAYGERGPAVSRIVRDREEEQIRGGNGVIQLSCELHGSEWADIHPLFGFSLHDSSGAIHPGIVLLQAEVAKNDPTSIRLITDRIPDEKLHVAYGLGLRPHCNVVDRRDLPLCAFLPRPLD